MIVLVELNRVLCLELTEIVAIVLIGRSDVASFDFSKASVQVVGVNSSTNRPGNFTPGGGLAFFFPHPF